MVILTDKMGNEIREQSFDKMDIDLIKTADFEMIINAEEWDNAFEYGGRIFVPDSEFGGIIGGIETATAEGNIKLTGHTWRGLLQKKIIFPPTGEAYKTVSGDLNVIIKELIEDAGLSDIFSVSKAPTITVTFQFDRYVSLYEGLIKMLTSVGYRLNLLYVQGIRGLPGHVEISAQPITDYSYSVELSQDSQLEFTFKDIRNKVNHLVALGQGELTDRLVLNLFLQPDGTVGSVPFYTGIEDVTEVYEDTTVSTSEELFKKGAEKLLELHGTSVMSMAIESLPAHIQIGDIVGGRDYITGLSMAEAITNKIYREEDNQISIEYEIGER